MDGDMEWAAGLSCRRGCSGLWAAGCRAAGLLGRHGLWPTGR